MASIIGIASLPCRQRANIPLSALQGGEGGVRRASDGRVRWASIAPPAGNLVGLTLTPTLSPSEGEESCRWPPASLILALIDQCVLLDPRHHRAQALADFLDLVCC